MFAIRRQDDQTMRHAISALGQSRQFGGGPAASGPPPIADMQTGSGHVSKVVMLLQKSFWGDDRNFLGPPMRLYNICQKPPEIDPAV
jgi:hypothetical protein